MEKYYNWFRKYWLNILIYSYLLFILYSTLVPFNFIGDLRLLPRRFSRVDWIPFLGQYRLISRSDVLANVIFFIPLGMLLGLRKILRFYRNYTWMDWLHIFLWGSLVSLSVEILQLLTFDRHTSITDVITNTVGTLLGALFIIVIYLQFRRQIKEILFTLFGGKPEMTISGMLLVFIFLSISMPFTFQPGLSSVLDNMKILRIHSVEWRGLWPMIPIHILIFGSFSYFLWTGIYRYFRNEITSLRAAIASVTVLLMPVFMELFQLLIPIRNHGWGDVVGAQLGLTIGIVFFYIQDTFAGREVGQDRSAFDRFFKRQLVFFQFLALIYILFLLLQICDIQPLALKNYRFSDFFYTGSSRDLQSLRVTRLNLLMDFNKEVFTFLPAGFILTLSWSVWKKSRNVVFPFLGLILLVTVVVYGLSSISILQFYFSLMLAAAVLGIWLGRAFWKIYLFAIIPHDYNANFITV